LKFSGDLCLSLVFGGWHEEG